MDPLGLNEDHGKQNGNYYIIMGYVWGYVGIMEKKMETTIMGYIGFKGRCEPFSYDCWCRNQGCCVHADESTGPRTPEMLRPFIETLKLDWPTTPLPTSRGKKLHSWKLTWRPKKGPMKTTVPLKWGYVGFHVSFQECSMHDLHDFQL